MCSFFLSNEKFKRIITSKRKEAQGKKGLLELNSRLCDPLKQFMLFGMRLATSEN